MGTYVITGANRGIGLELARQLRRRGDGVIAVCRSSSPELDELGVHIESGVDVREALSVAELAERLKGVAIDVLINNAGILRRERLDSVDFDGIEQQLE